MNEAFLFFSFVLEELEADAVERAIAGWTVLFLIASRIFAWSSALSEEISNRACFWL
jgi:hypothetical protein